MNDRNRISAVKLPDGHHAIKSGTEVTYVTTTGKTPRRFEGKQASKLWDAITSDGDDEVTREISAVMLNDGTENEVYAEKVAENPTYMSSYQAATVDHPFLDMSEGAKARRVDAEIMKAYLGKEDPPSPYLDIRYTDDGVTLPSPTDIGTDELFNRSDYRFALILGSGLARTRVQPEYDDNTTGYRQQHLIGKAVPSGGSRHPTEAFVEIHHAPEIRAGIYHFSTRYNSLFPVTLRSENEPVNRDRGEAWSATLHLCSYVPRAMYRYRDPRSARAIFVDVGHVDTQLQCFAEYCNWQYKSSVAIAADFGKQFGLSDTCPRFIKAELQGE